VNEIDSEVCPVYSVLADEATDCSNKEQMPIVLRYVDSKKEINECFVRFVECEDGMTGEALPKNIEDTFSEIGLPLGQCCGQGYDGASAMSSKSKGMSGRILQKNPKALYVHCSIDKTCGIQMVKNMLSHGQTISSFFSPSPKRTQLLKKKMKEIGSKRQKLGAPSTKRWVERITNLDEFVNAFEAIIHSLTYMKENENGDFDTSSAEAETNLNSILSFKFIVCLVITANLLHHTMSLTVQLQQRKIDIAESLKHINLLKAHLNKLCRTVEDVHDEYYDMAVELANNVKVEDELDRICRKQTARENYPADTARDYYRVMLTVPILDHLIEQMEFRFPSKMCNIYNGFYIIPNNFLCCKEVDWKAQFMKFVDAYSDDMPSYHRIHAELSLWETSWKENFDKIRYDSIADTLQHCNELAFPNIFAALKILAVLLVTMCECERSVSALRQMKTWLRNTMANERLNGLAQMHINDDIQVNVDKVINTFARMHQRRMQFLNILEDNEEDRE
jgi:hypothetical protein